MSSNPAPSRRSSPCSALRATHGFGDGVSGWTDVGRRGMGGVHPPGSGPPACQRTCWRWRSCGRTRRRRPGGECAGENGRGFSNQQGNEGVHSSPSASFVHAAPPPPIPGTTALRTLSSSPAALPCLLAISRWSAASSLWLLGGCAWACGAAGSAPAAPPAPLGPGPAAAAGGAASGASAASCCSSAAFPAGERLDLERVLGLAGSCWPLPPGAAAAAVRARLVFLVCGPASAATSCSGAAAGCCPLVLAAAALPR